jgi:hypothetical protein
VAERPSSVSSVIPLASPFTSSTTVPGPLPTRRRGDELDRGEEFRAIADRLQRKLRELHEDGVVDVVIDPREPGRIDVEIRYQPNNEPPPSPRWPLIIF